MLDRNVYKVVSTVEGQPTPPKEPVIPDKLVKYIPAEGLAAYAMLDPLFREAASGDALKYWLWAALVITVVFTFLYLRLIWNVTHLMQIVISCLALVAYVAGLGGPFTTIDGYKLVYGLIAGALLSLIMVFVPSPQPPPP